MEAHSMNKKSTGVTKLNDLFYWEINEYIIKTWMGHFKPKTRRE